MAELSQRLVRNAKGRFYVDISCTDCDLCRQIASDLFVRDDEAGYTYVARQPQDPVEESLATEAADCCPTNAIGMDGESEPDRALSM